MYGFFTYSMNMDHPEYYAGIVRLHVEANTTGLYISFLLNTVLHALHLHSVSLMRKNLPAIFGVFPMAVHTGQS